MICHSRNKGFFSPELITEYLAFLQDHQCIGQAGINSRHKDVVTFLTALILIRERFMVCYAPKVEDKTCPNRTGSQATKASRSQSCLLKPSAELWDSYTRPIIEILTLLYKSPSVF